MSAIENLLDNEGENQAVRDFLSTYQQDPTCTIGRMRAAMRRAGWDKCWPQWAEDEAYTHPLTKAGAQLWIRHLFGLEAPAAAQAAAAPQGDDERGTTQRAVNVPGTDTGAGVLALAERDMMALARQLLAERQPDWDDEFVQARANGIGSLHTEILARARPTVEPWRRLVMVPDRVRAAVERMAQPLDASHLSGVTAEADAICMSHIRAFIEELAGAPAAGPGQMDQPTTTEER